MKRLGMSLFVLCALLSATAFADDQYYYVISNENGVVADGVHYASPDAACRVIYPQLEATLAGYHYTVPSPYADPTLYLTTNLTAYYSCSQSATNPQYSPPATLSLEDPIQRLGDNCTDAQTYNPTSGQCENPDDDQDHNETGDAGSSQAADGVFVCPAEAGPIKLVTDPINAATGNEFESETDYQDNDGELRFSRYYNSSVGGWVHGYQTQLLTSPNVFQVNFDDGHSSLFKVSNGVATAQPPERGSLVQTNGQWTYTSILNEQFSFDSNGRLVKWRQANGLAQTLTYTTNPDYSSSATVTDSRGHTMTWQNSNYGLLTQLTAGDLTVVYTWNTTPSYVFQLTKVASTRANHTATRIYTYGDTRNPSWLTGLTDERGVLYASWTYDAQGRATTSQHAGGADATTVTYNSDGTSTVMNALGNSVTYTYQVIQGVNRITHIAGSPAASCPASNSSFTYYPSGQLQTATDALGHVTAYTYDTQGRQITRVEAQGTSQERTTTTQWDTTWAYLPKIITTADHTTTYNYDTQGRLQSTTRHDAKE